MRYMASLPQDDSSSSSAAAPGSASSTPRGGGGQVRLMCSFGGRILPRPHDHQLRYVGGETRIVSVPRSASFALLLSLLSKFLPSSPNSPPPPPPIVKYQLPHEDLDSLISVTSDEDVDNMMDELDRLSSSSSSTSTSTSSSSSSSRTPRLRLFLFSSSSSSSSSSPSPSSPAEPFGSVVDAGADKWFLDALNGSAPPAPPHLERGRSEASSVVSEVPDYLFGLDANSSASSPTTRSRPDPFSDDGPAEPDHPLHPHLRHHDHRLGLPNYAAVSPPWQPEPVPVYCVPAPVHGGSLPIRPVQYVASLGGQLPVGFAPPVRGLLPGPFYMAGPPGAGGDRYEAPAAGGVIVGPAFVPVYPSAPAPPGGASMGAGHAGELPGIAGGDLRRASQ